MNIFECNPKQLVLLAALIADQIALQHNLEEQEVIATVLRAISENVSIYVATEALREINERNNMEEES